MKSVSLPFTLKVRMTLSAVKHVLREPKYFVLAFVSVFIMSGLIIWSLNLDLLRYILFEAPLSFVEKLEFFSYTYESLYTTFDSVHAVGISVLSVLFGVNVAMLVYMLRRQGFASVPKKSGSGAFALAMIGGGCVACGTSIITPLLATLGATSSAFVRDISTVFLWSGSALTLYSIYKVATLIQVKKREN